jgi:hypothetical protein
MIQKQRSETSDADHLDLLQLLPRIMLPRAEIGTSEVPPQHRAGHTVSYNFAMVFSADASSFQHFQGGAHEIGPKGWCRSQALS